MKHNFKRILATVLVLCMVLSVLPANVFATAGQSLEVVLRYNLASDPVQVTTAGTQNVTIDGSDAFTVDLPAGYETAVRNGELNGGVTTTLVYYDAVVGEGTAHPASVAIVGDQVQVSGIAGIVDESEICYIDLSYTEILYNVEFTGTPTFTGKHFSDTVTVPEVPAVEGKKGLGWELDGRWFSVGASVPVSKLFDGLAHSVKDVKLDPVYINDTEDYLVLWTDSVTGLIYSYENVTEGNTATVPSNPVKKGYTFAGWDGTTTDPIRENTVFKAQWTANTYNIEKQGDNCTIAVPSTASMDQVVTLTTSPETGYRVQDVTVQCKTDHTYVPVITVSKEQEFRFTMPADDVQVTVRVAPATYTVKFFADGKLVDSISADYNGTITVPAVPAKPGYTGVWAGLGATVTVTGDAKYTATYTPNTYSISYNGATMTATYDDWFEAPAYTGAVADGQSFLGWRGNNGKLYIAGENYRYDVAADLALTPVFDNNTEYWTVKFVNVDGSLIDVEVLEQTTDATVMLPEYAPYPAAKWDVNGVLTVAGTEVDIDGNTVIKLDMSNYITVTFLKEKDGDVLQTVIVPAGTYVSYPVISKPGYRLENWASTGNNWTLPGSTFDADVVLWPQYQAEAYDVTYYKLPEGTAGNESALEADANLFAQQWTPKTYEDVWTAVPEGKNFLGWRDLQGRFYAAGQAYSHTYVGDLFLYPVFESDTQYWVVKFVSDGGLYDAQLFEQKAGNTITLPAEPVKEGYDFLGWYDGDTKVEDGDAVTGNATYTAKWDAYTRSIQTVDSEHATLIASATGATMGETVTVDVEVTPGYETYYIYTCTVTGKPVAMSQVAPNQYTFTMPGEAVFVAVADKAIRNTAKFVVDGEVYAFEYVDSGKSPVTPSTEPWKEGYTFLYWEAQSDGHIYATNEECAPIYADETYTAVFEINTYRLTYYRGAEADASEYKCILTLADGTMVEFFNNDTYNMPTYVVPDVVFGDTVTLGEPMLPGYKFLYWIDEAGYQHPAGSTLQMPAKDVYLTAVWEVDEESCLVRFMDNGRIYDAFLAAVGTTESIPDTDPTDAGRTFVGWQYDGKVYSHDNGISEFTVVADANKDMIFTAVWTEDLYTVAYTGDGVQINPVTDVLYGQTVVLADAPEREGFTFVAWEDTATGAFYNAKAAVEVKGDMTLAAVWSEDTVEYVVKFFDEKGNLVDVAVVTAGVIIVAPVYEQGRTDADYIWVDAENHLYYAEGEDIVVNTNLNFRATKTSEAEYRVIVTIEPSDVSNVAEALQDTYYFGQTAQVDINVPEGYLLKSVSALGMTGAEPIAVKDSLLPAGVDQYVYFFEMPASDVIVLVKLEKIPAGKTAVKFVVDGELYDYSIVTKGENGEAPAEEPSKPGYTFQYWQFDTTVVGAGGQFAVAPDADDVIVFNAVFTQNDYLVEYDTDGGVPQPAATASHYGEKITLAAAPAKDGYEFLGWVEESTGFLYAAGATYTVVGDVLFTARWELIPPEEYIVRFVDKDTNQIFGYEIVEEGDTVTAPVGPSFTGKTFVAWEDEAGNQLLPGNETYAIHADTVFYATYKINSHAIFTSTESCTISPASFSLTNVGELVTFTVAPNEKHAVESVTISYMDGPAMQVKVLTPDADGKYSFYMPDADVTITATAKQNVFSVYTKPDENTKINLIPDVNHATVGANVMFTVDVINPDYELLNVVVSTVDGVKPIPVSVIYVGTVPYYVFTMPAEDVNVHAQSVKAEYTVTYLDSDNTILDIVAVNSGDLAQAPAVAKEGYVFAGWEILPGKAAFDPAADPVTANLIVRATYVGEEKTVEAGLTDHVAYLQAECTVSSGNTNSSNLLLTDVLHAETGRTVYFTVAATYDYLITDIAVVSAEGTNLVVVPTLRKIETVDNLVYYTYAFEMPAENVTIDVYTAPKPFKVSVTENIPAGGDYTINGYYTNNLMVLQGEEVTVDVTPNPGYIIVNVSGTYIDNFGNVADLGGAFDGERYTFTMIAKDVSIAIEYEAIDYTVDIETSNFATYKPDASVNPAVVVESLDAELTSQGIIRFVGGADRDYTNALDQIYKIPANGTAIVGTRIAFTVSEYTGYDLDTITVTYDNGEQTCPLTLKDGVYYFDMPAYDVVITAIFKEETYTVTKDTDSEAHGAVVMNGLTENIISADYKEPVTVTVTPDDGYQVTKISYTLADGTVMDFDNASYTAASALTDVLDTAHSIEFHMPATDVTVYVEYAAIDYSITDVCGEATATYDTPKHVGDQVTFKTEVNYGYIIEKVYVVNDTTGARVEIHTASTNQLYGAEYTFTMPASSVTIHVETIKDEYNVKYLDNGALIAYENVEYLDTADVAGHVADVVNGKAGYHFVGWTSADVQTPVTAPSVTNDDFVIVKDTIIRAAYERDEIDVFFTATENGTVTELSTGNTAEYRLTTTVFGDTVKFAAVPDEGYVVDTVKVTTTNGEGYNLDIRYTLSGGEYTFMIPATYKADIHEVQAEDVVVTVTFKKDTFTLTRTDDCETDGEISVNGVVDTEKSFTYLYQDTVAITATPKPGYYVASITAVCADGAHRYNVDGTKPATDTAAGSPLTLTFQMPACDLTYTVDYEKIDYSITTVFNATQGDVKTDPNAIAQIDDIVTVTVTPKTGYELVKLTVTYAGGEKSCVLTEIAENVYTFTMPAAGVVVTAIFDEVTYTANLKVEGEADVTLNGYFTDNMDAQYLDTVTVRVVPSAGWELVSITVDGGKIKVNEEIKPAGGNYTFTMPNYDVDVEVKLVKTGFDMTAYALNFYETGHGTVTLDPKNTAYVGDRIIISADPDDGYRVKEVVVVDKNGYAVPVSFISGTPGYLETWSFTMPACDVKIVVYFEVQGSSYYTDVRTDFWFYDAVTFVTDRGYFLGLTEDLFGPNVNMDRAMFVTVLGRISKVDTSKYTGASFDDVKKGSYYAPYVAWAAENGIVVGRDAKTFDPHADITREEMAAIMYRYCKYLGVDMTVQNKQFMDRYEDTDEISGWAKEYVEWAVGVGLIRGMSDTTIDPRGLATRAQVAQVIKNLCDKVLYE